jgi:release factor glutamine methyltransferase
VSPQVLVPRPETELLVVHAIQVLRGKGAMGSREGLGLEIGLGSGAISIELLAEFPTLRMIASELEEGAASVARGNARDILGAAGVGRLEVRLTGAAGSVLEPLREALDGRRADFLISNPPYLDPQADEADEEVRAQEPAAALFAPAGDALFFYREIARGARGLLSPEGSVFVEMPHERAGAIRALFEESGWAVQTIPDLNERDRVLAAAQVPKENHG